jgi:O-acetyl-ADP-ribose deacetylase (regulator of RNase III)
MSEIQLLQGDITKLEIDVIVNAANNSLLGGGGVDGAIHRAAGTELLAECRLLNGCDTGNAKMTKGYNLSAKFIIHTVGPVWRGGENNEEKLLASCYRSCLDIAESKKFKSIAFPNISTGVYGFPKERAALIAISEVKKFIEQSENIQKVIFVCFDLENYGIYKLNLKI